MNAVAACYVLSMSIWASRKNNRRYSFNHLNELRDARDMHIISSLLAIQSNDIDQLSKYRTDMPRFLKLMQACDAIHG